MFLEQTYLFSLKLSFSFFTDLFEQLTVERSFSDIRDAQTENETFCSVSLFAFIMPFFLMNLHKSEKELFLKCSFCKQSSLGSVF